MATEAMNITEDAEMAECDGDKVVTMMDVLQEQQDFEEDANAVLGASDDKNCTYLKGYIKRQAIYACLTCCPDVKSDPTKRAGVCLACSLNCHENHELVELYTKRNFRCDCGNPKFNSNPCQFTPNKTDLNSDNIYNQNFSGLYCICQRPYPDPEAAFEDDMIQCIVCEDWLHASHLDAVVPANDQYSEMICKGCMEKNEFLHDYSNLAVNVAIVDIITVNGNHSDDTSFDNGNETKTITNAKDEALISNGDNVDLEKEKISETKEVNDKYDECDARLEQTKATEETASKHKEVILEGEVQTDDTDNKMDLESDSKKHELDCTEAKEISHDTNKDNDSPTDTVQKENDTALDATDNKDTSTGDQMESINENSEAAKEQKATDEQSINESNIDNDKTENNKVDTQLPSNIGALTTENPLEELKTSTEAVLADEEANDKPENPAECLEKVEHIRSNNSIDNTPLPPSEQTNELDASETKSGPESDNIQVPDTSQEKENMDDKTDAVMDAIDALLESNTDTKDCDSKETNEESIVKANGDKERTEDTNDVDMSENVPKQVDKESNNSTTDSNEKTGTDVEMTDNTSQNQPSDNENKVSNELLGDSEKNESVSVDTTQQSTNADNITCETPIDTDELSVSTDIEKSVNGNINKNDEDKANTTESTNENKRKLSITEETSPKKAKLNISKCERPKGVKKVHKGATFWPSNFRQRLCTCGECISMYKDLNVLFLTDLEDTVSYYESLGKENVDGGASQYEKGLQALSSLDRIQQINALTEYNKMRDKLLDFLKSFKDRKEIVKEEDIKAFFAGMKPKREPDGVYFCR